MSDLSGIPIKLSRAEQHPARIVGKPTAMFIIGMDWNIRSKFAIDPFGNKSLKLRSVVTSSAISPQPKLKKNSTLVQSLTQCVKPTIFNICK
jgi:hypothetical protein